MANKKYWQIFGELNNSEAYEKSISNEFTEELPFESADKKGLETSPASRRDFLKYLGFSTAAAVLADPEARGARSVDVRAPDRPAAGGLPESLQQPTESPSGASSAPGPDGAPGTTTKETPATEEDSISGQA